VKVLIDFLTPSHLQSFLSIPSFCSTLNSTPPTYQYYVSNSKVALFACTASTHSTLATIDNHLKKRVRFLCQKGLNYSSRDQNPGCCDATQVSVHNQHLFFHSNFIAGLGSFTAWGTPINSSTDSSTTSARHFVQELRLFGKQGVQGLKEAAG